MALTPSQTKALDLLLSNQNIFLTGAAGTGKSYLIKHFRNLHPEIPVVCSTGAAAVLVGGRTFHSFFGLGIMRENPELLLANALANQFLVHRIKKLKAIIIDEISMLPGRALDLANLICMSIRKNNEPFGGIKIVCVGDFYQLPPVTENNQTTDWAFKSYTWEHGQFTCVELQEFMRTTDLDFLKILANVREGHVTADVEKFLNAHLLAKDENFVGTRIFSRKQMVADYNEASLALLPGTPQTFITEYTGDLSDITKLQRMMPIENELTLKEKAFVMIRVNDSSRHQLYVNGTLGHILYLGADEIIIQALNGTIIPMKPYTFSLTDGDGDIIATAHGFPITLAYAITIHKSQGCSLDKALIDLKTLWQSGQAYTALSRLSNAPGLRVQAWTKRSVFVDKAVQDFYKSITKL